MVSHLALVRSIARRQRLHVTVLEEEDLVSAGTIGLIEAVDRYDARIGVPFLSFAYRRIKGAMIDEIRRLRVPAQESAAPPLPSLSLEGAATADGGLMLIEVTVDPSSPAPEARAELGELLAALERLPEREREMLSLYAGGNTLAEIADAFDCSESRVSQLVAQARLRLEERMAAA